MPRISELSSLTVPADDDLLAIVDNSGAITAKITREDFLTGSDLPDDTVTTDAIQDGSVTADKIDFSSGIWWEEIGRTTLGSSGDSIVVSGLPARSYLYVYIYTIGITNTITVDLMFNGDSSASYAVRASTNGGADATAINQTSIGLATSSAQVPFFVTAQINNNLSTEKFVQAYTIGSATGAGNAPARREVAGKWANTSSQINSISVSNNSSGDYAAGSTVIVLGHN